MNFTFLPGSIIGFRNYPEALFVRSLASGLAGAGHQVRVVEQRRNEFIESTLRTEGSDVYRHVYAEFPGIQFHTYEPRTGPRLLEWVSREMALSDVIVAVNGIPQELCRWIANLEQPGSIRIYMSFRPDELNDSVILDYEIEKFECVLATAMPTGKIDTLLIHPSIAASDGAFALSAELTTSLDYSFVTTDEATTEFLKSIQIIRQLTATAPGRSPNGATLQRQATLRSAVEPKAGE